MALTRLPAGSFTTCQKPWDALYAALLINRLCCHRDTADHTGGTFTAPTSETAANANTAFRTKRCANKLDKTCPPNR